MRGESPDDPGPAEETEDEEDPGGGARDAEAQLENAEGRRASAKDRGNEEYGKGNFEEAAKAWSRSLKSVKYILDKEFYTGKDDQLREVHEMELRLSLNLSQCFLKLREWRQAITFADRSLTRDAHNAKALYRKALALRELDRFAEAGAVLEKLLAADPDNPAARLLAAEVRRAKQVYELKARKVSQKMFSSVERDPRVPPTMYQWALEQVKRVLRLPFDALALVHSIPQRFRERLRLRDRVTILKADVRKRLRAMTQRAREAIQRISDLRSRVAKTGAASASAGTSKEE